MDLVVTDPPYVCRYRDRTGRVVANENHAEWISPAFREIHRVMKPNTLCVSFYGWQHVERFMLAWKAAGLTPVGHLVWPKKYASRSGFLAAQHEQAYLLAKGNPTRPAETLPDVQHNNAEHAVKAFVRLRRVIRSNSTAKGIKDYLVLLSLSETCKYKDIDFLSFLRSGEMDVDCFADRPQ